MTPTALGKRCLPKDVHYAARASGPAVLPPFLRALLLHPAIRRDGSIAEFLVEPMRVASGQAPATHAFERRVPLEFLEQALRDALAAEVLIDEHVAQPRERRTVGDDAGEAHGRAGRVVNGNGGDAVAERLGHHVAADARGPVGAGEHPVDGVEVLAGGVEGDGDGHGAEREGDVTARAEHTCLQVDA